MNLKRLLLLCLMGLSIPALQAQTIKFFKGTLNDARTEAKKQHKLIYVLAELGDDSIPVLGVQNDPELAKAYNAGFICIYRNFPDGLITEDLYLKFGLKSYPTHLFLDEEGGLILKTTGRRYMAKPYMTDLNQARELAKGKTLTKYDLEYKKGNRDLKFLKEYLLKYDSVDIPVDQELLREYISLLPVSVLDDYETILFIMEQGPVIYGKSYQLARTNTKLIDSIYKTLSSDRKVKMNNKMINSSRVEARIKKDEKIAVQTANYIATSWKSNWRAANNGRLAEMVNYYRSVSDTAKYLTSAFEYYQFYYQDLRDSIDKPEPLEAFTAHPLPKPVKMQHDTTIITGTGRPYKVRAGATIIPAVKAGPEMVQRNKALRFANILNNGAYSFYTMQVTKPEYLSRAVVWVKRSIELFPDQPGFYDTLSHLYYRQRKYDDAITTQEKAIHVFNEQAKKKVVPRIDAVTLRSTAPGLSTKEIGRYKTELGKMKARTL